MKPCQRLCISLLLVSDSYGHNHTAHKTATEAPETHKESFYVSPKLLVGRAVGLSWAHSYMCSCVVSAGTC